MIKHIQQINQPKPNPYCLAWNEQHAALTYVNVDITEFICLKQDGALST